MASKKDVEKVSEKAKPMCGNFLAIYEDDRDILPTGTHGVL